MKPGPQASLRLAAETQAVEDLVALVARGGVRVPAFQRGLKWKEKDVVALFDSIYRGYPVGSILLRKGKAEANRIQVGSLAIDAPETEAALCARWTWRLLLSPGSYDKRTLLRHGVTEIDDPETIGRPSATCSSKRRSKLEEITGRLPGRDPRWTPLRRRGCTCLLPDLRSLPAAAAKTHSESIVRRRSVQGPSRPSRSSTIAWRELREPGRSLPLPESCLRITSPSSTSTGAASLF